MNDCIFCKIIENEIKSTKLYENKSTIVIAPKESESKGHLLIIPKKHYKDIFEIPKDELNKIIEIIKEISIKLKKYWNTQGINLLHASGTAAQQSVPHFHIHIIPRFEKDNVDAWPKFNYKDKNREKIYPEIKIALNKNK